MSNGKSRDKGKRGELDVVRLEIPMLPPVSSSPNWRGHWAPKYQAARVYHNSVFYTCVDARNRGYAEGKSFPILHAKLDLTFVFAERRRRDRDNCLSRAKPGIDAIVDSGLILDDDAEHLQIGKVDIVVDPELAPLTIIELEEVTKQLSILGIGQAVQPIESEG